MEPIEPESRIPSILSFLRAIEPFKTMERPLACSDMKRWESNAEHSWHLGMFVMLFEKELPAGVDVAKMLKLALMHDLVELHAGDTFAFDKEGQTTKKEREEKAAELLFSKLPIDLSTEFHSLFQEYEASTTPESKFVKSFDKLQPILQNLCSEGAGWKKHSVTFDELDAYKRKHMTHDATILAVYESFLAEAKTRNLIS